MMKNIILSLCLIWVFTGCNQHRPLIMGEPSYENVVRKGTQAMFSGDKKMLTTLLISRAEFKESVFPNFPESGQMAPDDFWETFILKRRDARIGDLMQKFSKMQCALITVGKPKKSVRMSRITLHYQIPIEFECKGLQKEIWHDLDARLFGSIVEDQGKFKWLNAFWD